MEKRRNVVAILVCTLLSLSAFASADICGQSYVTLDGGENEVIGEGCTVYGQIGVGNATVTLDGGTVAEGGSGYGDATLWALAGSTVDIYDVTFVGSTYVPSLGLAATAQVTVYGSDFVLDGVGLDPSQTTIDSRDPYEIRTLSGVFQNGEAFSFTINLDTNTSLALEWPQTAPEIEVYPLLGEHDFGDIEIGLPQTYVVQILNLGTAPLEIASLGFDAAGSTDFVVTSAPTTPFTIDPNISYGVDIEITYTPSAEGYAASTLNIFSNDEDESLVEIAFGGVGLVVDLPPAEQIQAILDFIDNSIAEGTMVAYGPGNHPQHRLRALKAMIRSAGRLIDAGYPDWAACVLKGVDRKTDGHKRPPDFVVGEAVPVLNQMVNDLIEDLRS